MSKLEEFMNDMRGLRLVTLHGNRIMFHNEGRAEIQFWTCEEEDENFLNLKTPGVKVRFDAWEIVTSEKARPKVKVSISGNDLATFSTPSKKKIIDSHNIFYPDQFAVEMSEELSKNAEKGDWFDHMGKVGDLRDAIKKNLQTTSTKLDKETIRKSCVDIANYAMMIRYLYGEE